MIIHQFNINTIPTASSALPKASLVLLGLFLPLRIFGQANLIQLDGIVSQVEITEMEMIGSIGSAEFYTRKNENILKLSIKSEPIHVASICVAQNESIIVYHTSAALGAIEFNRLNKNWVTKDEFQWEMRNGDMTPEVIQQRQNYLKEHNWVATTTRMGNSGETEFYFDMNAFDSGPIYLAVGLMLVSNPDSIASFPELNAGACADHALVVGSPDAQYPFDYSSWIEITL